MVRILQFFHLQYFHLFTIIYFLIFSSLACAIKFIKVQPDNFSSKKLISSITLNEEGMLWLASKSNLWSFDGYNLKSHQHILPNGVKKIKKIYFDKFNVLWIGTQYNGLIKFDGRESVFLTKSNTSLNSNLISSLVEEKSGGLWVGTNKGLNSISQNGVVKSYPYVDKYDHITDIYITSILNLSKEKLLIATKKGLYEFHIATRIFSQVQLLEDNEFIVFNIIEDIDKNVWVASDVGIFVKKHNSFEFVAYKPKLLSFSITSIIVDKDFIWIGAFKEGLFKISKNNNQISKFTHNPNDSSSLSNNSIISLTQDSDNNIWVNTFRGGLNFINKNSLNFGKLSRAELSSMCGSASDVSGFKYRNQGLWVTTLKGLIEYSQTNESCKFHFLDKKNDLLTNFLYSANHSSDEIIWLSTANGLLAFNLSTHTIDTSYQKFFNTITNFSHSLPKSLLLVGTTKGLFLFNIDQKVKNRISDIEFSFHSVYKNNDTVYFATSQGVGVLNDKQQFILKHSIQDQLPTKDTTSIYISSQGSLWVATNGYGLFQFNEDDKLIKEFVDIEGLPKDCTFNSILEDDMNNIWVGTSDGLLRIDSNSKTHVFHESDGLQGSFFYLNSAYKAKDGKLYFGGVNGYNAFYPEDIKINDTIPSIVLTDFTRFGQSVQVGQESDGFVLEKPINELSELVLTHKDYVIGFEFAALDYTDPSRTKYAYMMEGLDPDWIYVGADNRRISYTNLKSGTYSFRVKGSNKDGIWNEKGKSLKVTVRPAPWFTWWAYLVYFTLAFCFVGWYIKRKNQNNININNMLKEEVKKQTKELHIKKQKIETLLAKKNELFANVSHEFRTPLTLILGPINKLLDSNLCIKDQKALKMIGRNASRLLTMIEQLLQIAKISSSGTLDFAPIKTANHIQAVFDSFKVLAQEKRITLQLAQNDDAIIEITKDGLEIVLGNLVSNAIKYTQIGGNVVISSIIYHGNKLHVSVTDTGCGLNEQQQKDIFNRFKRLDAHQNIEGVGIGLSIVEDLAKVNNAHVVIKSKPGEGSSFTIIFNTVIVDFDKPSMSSQNMLPEPLCVQNPKIKFTTPSKASMKSKDSILIIDDNKDMLDYIETILEGNYNCLFANGGKKGISLAIEHVPDIIICDVMMPEMDGFHVSRILRSDSRTSHIPLVLLTALDDIKSRIRGWREHVDAYLTKPFDTQELLLQLENILVIRNILKKKVGEKIKTGKANCHIDLPKKDQQFIDKLNQLIIKKYKNPNYLRPQMAKDMAVSEKQLQRKLKALIDINPMSLLREYRLRQAATLLKDGYQVGFTSDECGFNSVTYFSYCFKAHYGMPPKVYQKTCKKI